MLEGVHYSLGIKPKVFIKIIEAVVGNRFILFYSSFHGAVVEKQIFKLAIENSFKSSGINNHILENYGVFLSARLIKEILKIEIF